jgi:hypothetical protein
MPVLLNCRGKCAGGAKSKGAENDAGRLLVFAADCTEFLVEQAEAYATERREK